MGRRSRRASHGPHHATDSTWEEIFLHSCEFGDIPTVQNLVTQQSDFLNFNCCDILGRTPLRLAVENEHLEIVELLLERTDPKSAYDALLLAISLDHDDVALCILKHPIYQQRASSKVGFRRNDDDSLFSSDTTPLNLAAKRNRYEIVSFLLQNGETIEEPHLTSCNCNQCIYLTKLDDLRFAKSRLNTYKGLASNSYVCLQSEDAITRIFQLKDTLLKVADHEKHYKEYYMELCDNLDDLTMRLLNEIRDDEELDVLLNGKDCDALQSEDVTETKLKQIQTALIHKEKKFVTHPSCQKKLAAYWYGDLQQKFSSFPKWTKHLQPAILAACYPILAIIYWCAPNTRLGQLMRIPYVKFIGQTTMFFVFLVLLMATSMTTTASHGNILNYDRDHSHEDMEIFKRNVTQILINNLTNYNYTAEEVISAVNMYCGIQIRHFYPTAVQIALNIWLAGMLWTECKQVAEQGFKVYFSNMFNSADYLSLTLFTASFTLKYLTYIKTHLSLLWFDGFHTADSFRLLLTGDTEAKHRMYWLLADRYYWDDIDPVNVAEGLYAVATILIFFRMSHILAASESLGPLQRSLRLMIVDFFMFMLVFGIVIVAFLFGLRNLYWYYNATVRESVEISEDHNHGTTNAEEAFGSMERAFITVFWSLFGLMDSNVVQLRNGYRSQFTETVGYFIFGAYNISTVIVLLNMLIAMMSRSFRKIQDHEDVEWKFVRAELYMEYIEPGSTLPYPYNIFPSPKSIGRVIVKMINWCCGNKPTKKTTSEEESNKNIEDHSDEQLRKELENLAAQMILEEDSVQENGRESDPNEKSKRTQGAPQLNPEKVHSKMRELKEMFNMGDMKNKLGELNQNLDALNLKDIFLGKGNRSQNNHLHYDVVLKRIIKRFIFNGQKKEATQMEVELEELKKNLSSFRYEIKSELDFQKTILLDTVDEVSCLY